MKVKELKLKNFRNSVELTFYPSSGLNFLIGANGEGKTSILEALGFLATLRSFRESKTANVIQWGNQVSEISCKLESTTQDQQIWTTDLNIYFQFVDPVKRRAKKSAFINKKPYQSSTQYLSQRFGSFELGFHTVIFNPSDHDLVRGEPSIRRSYIDCVLAAQNIDYLKTLQKYNRVLSQRNALLKQSDHYPLPTSLFEFTEQLCAYGSLLTNYRLQWIQKLEPLLKKILKQIAPEQAEISLSYHSSWCPSGNSPGTEKNRLKNNDLHSIHFSGQEHLPSLKLLEGSFLAKARFLELMEMKLGYSLVGPHRDDWSFLMGGQVLRGHGSQGEVRSVLLALKLAEIELFQKATGHRPLFLLDDFSSELDQRRRSFLLKFLSDTELQTFVTTTEDLFSLGKKFLVCNGRIEEGKA